MEYGLVKLNNLKYISTRNMRVKTLVTIRSATGIHFVRILGSQMWNVSEDQKD